jgi:hypothetical protein
MDCSCEASVGPPELRQATFLVDLSLLPSLELDI